MDIRVDNEISLELLREDHAQELFELTDSNREYLRKWLPWLDFTNSVSDTTKFIESTIEQFENRQGPQFALKYNGVLCGVNGFHKIDTLHKSGAIGYWLSKPYNGKGIITKSAKELLKIGFDEYSLHKIEIHCAEGNTKSRAIAERLGFIHEATLRDCEWLYTKYVSHAIYSMLESEFNA